MKKILLISVIILFACSSVKHISSNKKFRVVDYNLIEAAISDKDSKFYYPKLMKRIND